eukprot:CAMPEP_0194209004 /NCGR_PEP_ID=MMETSP0156-20130528/7284_1 /TAXON_ID=33649 /ORGANISM="Thalassionema nitzschioides, Strain L26-B" /LENGTH=135 /DNA_ID=CAMNT_0038936087 /DNA_START=240 /DNA_END=647 /DNA_ORIENTATION=+
MTIAQSVKPIKDFSTFCLDSSSNPLVPSSSNNTIHPVEWIRLPPNRCVVPLLPIDRTMVDPIRGRDYSTGVDMCRFVRDNTVVIDADCYEHAIHGLFSPDPKAYLVNRMALPVGRKAHVSAIPDYHIDCGVYQTV